jgi:hypothetical protein
LTSERATHDKIIINTTTGTYRNTKGIQINPNTLFFEARAVDEGNLVQQGQGGNHIAPKQKGPQSTATTPHPARRHVRRHLFILGTPTKESEAKIVWFDIDANENIRGKDNERSQKDIINGIIARLGDPQVSHLRSKQ